MSTSPVPTYPIVYVDVAGDGSAHVNVAGRHHNFAAAGRATTRQRITAYAATVASELNRPVRMQISDPEGQWLVAVHPDGTVTDLTDTPTKNRRPRRQAATIPAPPEMPVAADPHLSPPPSGVPSRPPARSAEPLAPSPMVQLPEMLDLERTVLSRRQAAPPQEPAQPMVILTFSTGEVAHVTGAVLIGRSPSADPGEDTELTITIDDESRKLSRTHLRIEWHDGRLWATDRDSGNGTVIERAGVAPVELTPWQPFCLHDQDLVLLGTVRLEISFVDSSIVDLS